MCGAASELQSTRHRGHLCRGAEQLVQAGGELPDAEVAARTGLPDHRSSPSRQAPRRRHTQAVPDPRKIGLKAARTSKKLHGDNFTIPRELRAPVRPHRSRRPMNSRS
jgi:hypothetical protein